MFIVLTFLALVGMAMAAGGPAYHYWGECYEYKVFCRNPADMTGISNYENSDAYCKDVYGGVGLATINKKKTWKGIKAALEAEGMHNDTGYSCSNYGFWIGFADRRDPKLTRHKAQPSLFSWDYEMCTYFESWAPNEPNDNITENPDGQNCVQLWYRSDNAGRYDDEYCTESKGFVCQKEIDCFC